MAARRPPFIRRPRGRAGYTLVEVVLAMLLTTVIVTSVFSVALTTKGGGGKAERKLKAAAGARRSGRGRIARRTRCRGGA